MLWRRLTLVLNQHQEARVVPRTARGPECIGSSAYVELLEERVLLTNSLYGAIVHIVDDATLPEGDPREAEVELEHEELIEDVSNRLGGGDDVENVIRSILGTLETIVAFVDARLDGRLRAIADLVLGTPADDDDGNDDPLTLELDVSANSAPESNGTLLTNVTNFQIAGTTAAGATVEVARDPDGLFNDGVAIADENGLFTIDVTLLHDDANLGANSLTVRSTRDSDEVTSLLDVHLAIGTVVRVASSQGAFDIELLDADAPQTVAAFLADLSRYDNSFFHRTVDQTPVTSTSLNIAQAGGFKLNDSGLEVDDVDDFIAPPNEAGDVSPPNSNVAGTISTAQISTNINSFTGEFFFNTEDNLFLDNVPHTVFGRVIGTGLEIPDGIDDLETFNLNGTFFGETALGSVPLIGYTPFTEDITGSVSVAAGTNSLTGVGTSFTTELQDNFNQSGAFTGAGSAIRIGTEEFVVSLIVNDTELLLDRAHPTGATSVAAQVNAIPAADLFVGISEITILLNATSPSSTNQLGFATSPAPSATEATAALGNDDVSSFVTDFTSSTPKTGDGTNSTTEEEVPAPASLPSEATALANASPSEAKQLPNFSSADDEEEIDAEEVDELFAALAGAGLQNLLPE